MEIENILKFDVTLQKLAAITVALHFWELETVKKRIHDFWKLNYYIYHNYPEFTKVRKEWTSQNIGYVEKMVDSLDYPAKLLDDIKCYLHVMGGLILDFIHHTSKYGFDADFGLKICWAPYGRIDEVRMVKKYLKKRNESPPLEDRFLFLAGIYTKKRLIKPTMKRKNYYDHYDVDHLLFEGRYHWNKLPVTEKREQALDQARLYLRQVLNGETNMYTRQRHTELLIFFMTEMPAIQRLEFITESWGSLFKAFLETWPYQELCLNILCDIEFEDFKPGELLGLIHSVINSLNSEWVIKYKNKNIYHPILQKLLKKTPSEFKITYLKNVLDPEKGLILDFHRNCDYRTLSIILNDVVFERIKQQVILGPDYFDRFFKMHVKDNNFDFLNKYSEYVLSNEEERKLFKKKLNWVSEFACEGDFELADQLLNFLFDTETERNQQKKKIHGSEVFKFIKERNFEKAQQFVEWRYETDEERKKVKNAIYILDDIEPSEHFADIILRENFSQVDHYLKWRFETEEERRKVKESALKGIDSVEVCNRLLDEKKGRIAGKYLQWRYQSMEERHKIEQVRLELQRRRGPK